MSVSKRPSHNFGNGPSTHWHGEVHHWHTPSYFWESVAVVALFMLSAYFVAVLFYL